MNPNLVKSALFSAGVHLSILIPFFGSGVMSALPEVDLVAGMSSVELEWVDREAVPSEEEGEGPAGAARRLAAPPEEWLQDVGVLRSFSGPRGIANPVPLYPRDARLRGWEGTMLIQASVNPLGAVTAAGINRSSGHASLDGAALAAVRQWRFRPARRKGQAVASQVEVPITFRLKQQSE